LGTLNALQYLHLSENQLTGAIPSELGNLSALIALYLAENELTDIIPPELGNLSTIQYLRVEDNQLTGSLPETMGNLTELVFLDVSGNPLQGSLPPSLTNLAQLGTLFFTGTDLCAPADDAFQTWLQGINSVRGATCMPTAIENTDGIPATYTLDQNYPNPFNPTTTIRYGVPVTGPVRLAVYDLLGREVAVLVDATLAPGTYRVVLDAAGWSSGIYLYRLAINGEVRTRRLTLVK
jgi:hypothetical protein